MSRQGLNLARSADAVSGGAMYGFITGTKNRSRDPFLVKISTSEILEETVVVSLARKSDLGMGVRDLYQFRRRIHIASASSGHVH